MNDAQVGILIQAHKVSLGYFLLIHDSGTLGLQVILVLFHDFANQALERALKMRRSIDFWYLQISLI
jgi:hypothetical protein